MNSQSHIANTNFDLWSVRILYHLSHQRKNCAFAHFQNKFEKCRLFACFFFSRPSATRISLASWSCLTFEESLCVGTALIIHFENKFEKCRLFACFFFSRPSATRILLASWSQLCGKISDNRQKLK